MQFSDTSNKSGLIQDCEILLNFPDAGISGDTTLLKQFTNLINQAYLKTIGYVLESSGTWEWDDPNHTDFPIATTTLVNNQQDYTLPVAVTGGNASGLLTIQRVEVMDSAGDYYKLDPIDETNISEALAEFEETAGKPRFYRTVGHSVELYPKPSTSQVTASEGLKCYFQRTPDLFTSADTTQQPGIPQPFHRLLSLEACMDYASIRGLPNVQYLQTKIIEVKASLQSFYGQRNKDVKTRINPRRERYN